MNRKLTAVGGAANPIQDLEELNARFDRFAEDRKFLESMRAELRNQYPDCWVAVYQKRVAGTGKRLRDVIRQLDSENVPKDRVVLEYLPTEPIAMIL